MPRIYTSLCKLLDIEVPIIQAPISGAANPGLVAAVSNAGGLGTFAMHNRTPEGIRELIEEAQRLTSRPFCANFILLPNVSTEERLQVCLDAGVNVVQFFWEEPYQFVNQVHESGALVMYTVPSAEAARTAVDAGVDIIVAQGWEAGGHVRGEVATMALVPRVVDAVPSTPVVAAGGIADGRGLAAALALGAAGVVMGTRFLASEEAIAHPIHQERLMEARETDTLRSTVFESVDWPNAPGRALRNTTIERWEDAGRPAIGNKPGEEVVLGHTPDGRPIGRYLSLTPVRETTGDIEAMGLWAGQSVGLVDRVLPVEAIIKGVLDDAAEVLFDRVKMIKV